MTGYRVDADTMDGAELVTVIITGASTFETIAGLLRDLEALAPQRVLIDESGMRASLVSPAHIREIADLWKSSTALRTARIAAYSPNLVVFGLNRMFQLVANSEDRVAVFKDRAEAVAWLLRVEVAR